MDKNIAALMSSLVDPWNPIMLEGIAKTQMNGAMQYMDEIVRCASESFPKGLVYHDLKQCDPVQVFNELTRAVQPRRMIDLAISDIYMIELSFSWNGFNLPKKYLYLPYIRDNGFMFLKGTRYQVLPVLSGVPFNIENDAVYMPIPRARLGYRAHHYSCIKDGLIINKPVTYSYLHNKYKRGTRSSLYPTLLHYIFSKYGFKETLKQFFNMTPLCGYLPVKPKSGYIYYRSRKPIGNKAKPTSQICFYIKESDYTPEMDTVFSNIFYILDNSVSYTVDFKEFEDPHYWLRLLDTFLAKEVDLSKKRFSDLQDHLANIEGYMDTYVIRLLYKCGINCSTVFDLFKYMIVNYNELVVYNDPGTMYNTEVNTVQSVLFDLVYDVFKTMFALQALAKLPSEQITVKQIVTILNRRMPKDRVFNVSRHANIQHVNLATDCKQFGPMYLMMDHNSAASIGGGKKRTNLNNPNKLLHASQVDVCSPTFITHADNVGRCTFNPNIRFSRGSRITPANETKEAVAELTITFKS
jgi:hypothetical protein